MEINKRLVMTFKTTDDKKVSLSVDDPREDKKFTLQKLCLNFWHSFFGN